MSDKANRNVGMPAGAVSPSRLESAAQLAAHYQQHAEKDRDGNLWFREDVDLNRVLEQIGNDAMNEFLVALCGSSKVKFERLSANAPLPLIVGVGQDYHKLRAAAKAKELLTINTRISHTPAAFASLSQETSSLTDAVLTV